MGAYLSLPILFVAVVLQSTFVPQARILGGQPDLTFLLVIAWAMHAPFRESIAWAMVGGIMQDLMSAVPTGASALGMIILIYVLDRVREQLVGVGLLTLIGFVLAGTLWQHLVFQGVMLISGFSIRPLSTLTNITLPSMAYNLILMIPIYWIVRRIQRRLGEQYA
ncbi:rod shape-determining protein MreD [Anaerolineae bacterium CFX9]|jgi:rod shape-determining protein MreD|nr:rod shape-determining protein MreD [Anaerolineae bacterium CFX9]